jgi:hypothetical protein
MTRVPAVHAGLPFSDHLPVDTPAIEPAFADEPTVSVPVDFLDDHHLAAGDLTRKRLTGSLMPGLRPLRRVDLGEPDLECAALIEDVNGFAVDYFDDPTSVGGSGGYQRQRQQDKGEDDWPAC